MIEEVLGAAVVVTGLASRTIGEGAQIMLNWRLKAKAVAGLSPMRYALNFLSFASYVLYTSFGNQDWFIFTVASFGVLGTGTVLVQMRLYRLRPWTCPHCGAANTLGFCTSCGKIKGQ